MPLSNGKRNILQTKCHILLLSGRKIAYLYPTVMYGLIQSLILSPASISHSYVKTRQRKRKERKQLRKWLWHVQVLKDGLSTLHVPYSYGFAIILLTILVKAATFPLTKKQVSGLLSCLLFTVFLFSIFLCKVFRK